MPGKRIKDLTALSGAGSANNDDVVIFDADADVTKRISRSQLAEGMQADVQVLTNKTMALGSNTVTGTTAQFNTALTDNNFATQAGAEALSNKTIDSANNTLTINYKEAQVETSNGSRTHLFTTVAALLADTGTYTTYTAGQIVEAGGFRYTVAATGATDHHVITAGSVKLYVLPINGEYFDTSFGVDGIGDDTIPLSKAWATMVTASVPLVLTKSCTITSPIGSDATAATASVLVRVVGSVTWTVDAASAAFSFVVRTESTAAGNCIVVGGTWSIVGNNKAGTGIYYRHYAASQSGRVQITAKIICRSLTENNAAATHESGGIICIGDFANVHIMGADVDGVTRTNSSGGACSGIAISEVSGNILIDNPTVKNVLTGPSNVDADGIKCFNKLTSGRRVGTIKINNPVMADNQGRHIKTQSESAVVLNPKLVRQLVVSITQSVDIDFQECGGVVVDPEIEYRKNGATSPLGTSHSPIAASFNLSGVSGTVKVIGGTYRADVQTNRIMSVNCITSADKIYAAIDGLVCVTLDPAITSLFTRSVLEVGNMDTLLARADDADLIVKNITGPIGCLPIGYTSYTSGGSPGTYLYCEASNISNTGAVTTQRPFYNLSGNAVVEYKGFLIRDNLNIQPSFFGSTLTFDFQKLVPGCRFYCDIANNTITRGPAWGATGFGFIEVLDGCSFMNARATDRTVRAQVAGSGTMYTTHNGGVTWVSN